jgi:hypothetical protein
VPNGPLGFVKVEEGSVDSADEPKSSTQPYIRGNINHETVLKTTRSLYQLALVTSDPWATISVQDSFVTNAFRIACRQHSTTFIKTPELHKKVCILIYNFL